jgi:hypothetical protein
MSLGAGRRQCPGGLQYNLGAAPVDAKGTTWDYLTHHSAIPVQIMALQMAVFPGWLRLPGPVKPKLNLTKR